jgi:hypothetical protein
MFKTALVLALALTFLLVAREIATGVIYRDIRTTGDNTSYLAEQRRNEHEPLRNSLGLREREFSREPDPGAFRIAVMGDLLTCGQGIDETGRLTERNERHLNRAGREFEAPSFGQSGAEYEGNPANLAIALDCPDLDFILVQWFFI